MCWIAPWVMFLREMFFIEINVWNCPLHLCSWEMPFCWDQMCWVACYGCVIHGNVFHLNKCAKFARWGCVCCGNVFLYDKYIGLFWKIVVSFWKMVHGQMFS
jgi:hypothetical protein